MNQDLGGTLLQCCREWEEPAGGVGVGVFAALKF